MSDKYFIGQRVIYSGVICTVCAPEIKDSSFVYWVDNPEKGHKHGVATHNLKPLPNGQL